MSKISVGILGATGMVGQTIIQLLENHPWFEVTELAASEKSAGNTYGKVMSSRWNVSSKIPQYVEDIKIKECRPVLDCDFVLSALDSGVAKEIEENFAKAGYGVSSNAKNHRMDEDVPLLIPEINASHLDLIKKQQKNRNWKGFIVTDPNCCTIGLCLGLKPLFDSFGLEKVMVTTLQSLSGAGYPGVPSMDIVDNIIPFIHDEEDKIQTEPLKIFGILSKEKIKSAKIGISAQCNRVGVKYGHTECVSVKLSKKASKEEVIAAFKEFRPDKSLNLPSSPKHPVIYMEQENRPQPRFDVNVEGGMSTVIGRLRPCNILDYKFVLLSHNLIRGAAGAAILNAELLKATGYIS